jgi:hypothetical protein
MELDPKEGAVARPTGVIAQNPVTTGVRKQLSIQEWEDLKPLIRELYIEEGRKFAYVQDVLLRDHNFKPTYGLSPCFDCPSLLCYRKKQFDDRIKKWKMRKNTNKHERKNILQNVEALGEDSEVWVVEVAGRRHKKTKLERWQKEFQEGSGSYRMGGPSKGEQGKPFTIRSETNY